jgi:hypothetical protein
VEDRSRIEPFRDDKSTIDAIETHLPLDQRHSLLDVHSGSAAQLDDRQMIPALDVAHREPEYITAVPAAMRPVRPLRSRLE